MMKRLMQSLFALIFASFTAHADTFGAEANQFTIDFVNIGNAGNPADTWGRGYGSVGYNYRIGKYEVTIEQFAKAHAADSRIGNGNWGFWNDGTRTVGSNGPASFISWYEAAKFCNWLTTGDAYTGAYLFSDSGVLQAVDRDAALLGYDMVYVLPSEDEWHKAAYFKPDASGYSYYASGLNTSPTKGGSNGWNYDRALSSPNEVWEVGFGAEEQNGTHDMMGNIWEWNESAFDGNLDDMSELRSRRGGAFYDEVTYLHASPITADLPTTEYFHVGFRVASIEPLPTYVSIYNSAENTVEIRWSSISGETYQVQYSTDLNLQWFDLGNSVFANADSTTNRVFDSTLGSSKCFYRVIIE